MKRQINIVISDEAALSLSADMEVSVENGTLHIADLVNKAVLDACQDQDKAVVPPGKYSLKLLVSVQTVE